MAALRQLLNRGLLAGRRAAAAPPPAPRPLSTATTATGASSHVPQLQVRSSHLGIMEYGEPLRNVLWLRHKYWGRITAALLAFSGLNYLSGRPRCTAPTSSVEIP